MRSVLRDRLGVTGVYRLAGSVIEVVAVGPRATIYEETWRRVRRQLPSR